MPFEEILDQVIAMLQRRGRVTYRALQRQFNLDDAFLEDLKEEPIHGQQLVVDEDGKVLIWTGGADRASAPSPPIAFSPATASPRVPLAYTPPYLTEKILDARPRLEGERKQVTVLFADIKDSTELIRDLDPEAAQQLLDPALQRMMDAVHRYEGTVNQVLGDGIMALFGAPIAHEDHALRACYAALAMQAAMREYTEEVRRTRGLELRVRVGLNAGEVVVRAIGNDLHMDYSAVGQTTHLAARMEQLATPGSIRLTASTLRLVEGLVQINALGPIPVKGLPEPVEVFELVGEPGAYRLVKPVDSLPVPATVQAVLAARIDRLATEQKRLLQTAAVIGTEVPLPLLQAIAELPEAAVHGALAHLQAQAQQNLGLAYRAQGDYQRAIDCFGQTVAFLDGARRRERFGQFFLPEVSARAWLAWCHADLGTFAAGRVLGEEGLQIAEAAAHPSSLMLASWGSGLLCLRQGDLDRARSRLERAMGICQDIDSPATFPLIAAALGTAYTLCGRVADAVPLLTQAIEPPTGRILALYQALPQLSLAEAALAQVV